MSERESSVARSRPGRSRDADGTTSTLVAVCGLPGVGKTTVAEDIAKRVDGHLLRTDVIRKEILTDPQYTEEESRMVYDEMFERGRELIEEGRNVVLDATFTEQRNRERALSITEMLDAEFRMVRVRCDEDGVRRRIAKREGDESDADFEVHALYREKFEPLSMDHVIIDNSDGLEATYRQVREHF